MKKEVKKVQNKIENSETETPEEIIVSSEEVASVIEVKDAETKPIAENANVPSVNDVKDAGTKPIVENANVPSDNEVKDAETKPIVENANVPSDIDVKDAKPIADDKESETKPVVENAVLNKQKIKAVKRALENKTFSLEREKIKCSDWLKQADTRDSEAKTEFEKRKNELEELLKKNTVRYEKRMAKTKLQWRDYTANYLNTKVKKIEDDITLLNAELSKLESLEPTQETK